MLGRKILNFPPPAKKIDLGTGVGDGDRHHEKNNLAPNNSGQWVDGWF